MDPRDSEHVAEFEKALAAWDDHRFLTADQLRDLAMFSLYLVNLAEADGWEYDGHSWKKALPLGCLTVRATVEGVPSVVFTSGRTYTGCVSIFLRKLAGDMLEWRPDKFRV